ncbi:MAG: GNAT family N-acetyltransferase [Proteobacteria bacterium]|nr:GNAT family N-acetyltransferase [Pseudomonadota bacterium]
MELLIRPVELKDVDDIAALLAELAREDGHTYFDVDRVIELVRDFVNATEHAIYVADHDGVVGYVAVHWIPFPMLGGREGYISDLVIRATDRGTGIGSCLLSAVEARARELGCVRLMLNNRTTSESYRRAFYFKHGFRQRDQFANLVKTFDHPDDRSPAGSGR